VADRNYGYETLKVDEAPLSLSVWRTAAMGLAGRTLFLWPLLALALARPDATLGEMISDAGLCY
jgi:hypothetical protein